MSALEAILEGIASAAAWESLRRIFYQARYRNGELAGGWFQVTYNSDDPSMEGEPWSIEWAEVLHHGHNIRGKVWRIYKNHFERSWQFRGKYDRGEILGYYWQTRGSGGSGVFWLDRQRNALLFKGGFMERRTISNYDGMPMEWVKVGSDDQERVVAWLRSVPTSRAASQLPRKVCVKLYRIVAEHGWAN